MSEFTITITSTPEPVDVEVVKQGLDAYDASQGATVDWLPLAAFARLADSSIIAGLTGSTYGDTCTSGGCGPINVFVRWGLAANCWRKLNRKLTGVDVMLFT